jgi:hypothetical protein
MPRVMPIGMRFSAWSFRPRLPVNTLPVAGFRLCRSGENVNDQLRTLKRLVDVMIFKHWRLKTNILSF